jgi:hypothetical protein
MTLQAGQLFGNYCVVQLIGEGGFEELYLVENELIQRRAAVKVLHPALAEDAELVRRFLNEARAASAICHPNIVEVLDTAGQSSATVANRTALPARSTTFSRATGEVGEAVETEEALLAATRRRWPLVAVGGVVVLGGVMLLMLRPSRDSVPRPMSDTGTVATGSAAIASPSVPIREEGLQKAEPRVQAPIPSKATGSQALPVGLGELPATKPTNAAASTRTEHSKRTHQVTGQTTSRRTIREWNSDERWLAH